MSDGGPLDRRSNAENLLPQWLRVGGAASWRLIGIGLVTYALYLIAARFLVVVVPMVVALILTTFLAPVARSLEARGVPRTLATWLALLLGLVAAGALMTWLIPTIADEVGALRSSLDEGIARIELWLVTGPTHMSQERVDTYVNDLRAQISAREGSILRGALAEAPLVADFVAGILLTIVFTFFMLKDGARFADALAARSGAEAELVRARLNGAWASLTGYGRGASVNGIVNGALLGIGLAVLGVPLAAPIAAITFLAAFVPLAGGILSGALAAVVALVAKGPVAAIVIVLLTAAIHNLEGYLVGPIVIGRQAHVHPIILLVAVALGAALAGVAGAFLAGPVVAAISGFSRPLGTPEYLTPD